MVVSGTGADFRLECRSHLLGTEIGVERLQGPARLKQNAENRASGEDLVCAGNKS